MPPTFFKYSSYALQDTLLEHEGVLARAHADALAELRARATAAPVPADAAAGAQPDVANLFDMLRMILMRADGVWEAFLDAAERQLPPADFVVAAIAYHEISHQLRALHLPWQAAQRGAVPS